MYLLHGLYQILCGLQWKLPETANKRYDICVPSVNMYKRDFFQKNLAVFG